MGMRALTSGQCLFSFPPTRESLLLVSIVRTRFQFVVLTLVAVEVNDLLGSIAFFGHTASPSGTVGDNLNYS